MPKADRHSIVPAQYAQQFGSTPRLMPIVGDAMEPTLRNGDFVVVVPVERFRCDGLYVLMVGNEPVVHRCQSNFRGGIRVRSDNARYSDWTYTREQFEAAVLGAVFATCNVVDRTLIEA